MVNPVTALNSVLTQLGAQPIIIPPKADPAVNALIESYQREIEQLQQRVRDLE